MPRSALLCPEIEIWGVAGNLGLEIGMLRAKQQGCCKTAFVGRVYGAKRK